MFAQIRHPVTPVGYEQYLHRSIIYTYILLKSASATYQLFLRLAAKASKTGGNAGGSFHEAMFACAILVPALFALPIVSHNYGLFIHPANNIGGPVRESSPEWDTL
jgi:hypothetical protein